MNCYASVLWCVNRSTVFQKPVVISTHKSASIILQFLSGGEFWGIISGALLKMELSIRKGAW